MVQFRLLRGDKLYTNSVAGVTVYKGTLGDENIPVAIKEQLHASLPDANAAINEGMITSCLTHSGVIKLYTARIERDDTDGLYKSVLVLELMEKDLAQEIRDRRDALNQWSEDELLFHLEHLVSALAYAKAEKVSHRDIKPQNIFLSENRLKIGDFGSSAHHFNGLQERNSVHGTPFYMSPEMRKKYAESLLGEISENSYDPFQADVFSLGITFVSMVMLNMPTIFAKMTCDSQEIDILLSNLWQYPRLTQFLARMLVCDPNNRITFEDLLTALRTGSFREDSLQAVPQKPAIYPSKALCALCRSPIENGSWRERVYNLDRNSANYCSIACFQASFETDSACIFCSSLELGDSPVILECGHCFDSTACLFEFLKASTKNFSQGKRHVCTQCEHEITTEFIKFAFGGGDVYDMRVAEIYKRLCCICYERKGATSFPRCHHNLCPVCVRSFLMVETCPVCGPKSRSYVGF